MRILCLDIGTKRIGVAISDPLGWTAQPLTTMERRNHEHDCRTIMELCRAHDVEKILVGDPLDAEGRRGESAKQVERFTQALTRTLEQEGLSIPVETWDERYSTQEAQERLIASNVSRKKRKQVIDKMAAVVILESYLRERQ